jgi:hypothetical protein
LVNERLLIWSWAGQSEASEAAAPELLILSVRGANAAAKVVANCVMAILRE